MASAFASAATTLHHELLPQSDMSENVMSQEREVYQGVMSQERDTSEGVMSHGREISEGVMCQESAQGFTYQQTYQSGMSSSGHISSMPPLGHQPPAMLPTVEASPVDAADDACGEEEDGRLEEDPHDPRGT